MVDRSDYRRTEKHNTRGKVLGGSSCLNYFSWMRGSRAMYDDWAKFGGEEWNFDNCFKYLRKVSLFPFHTRIKKGPEADVSSNRARYFMMMKGSLVVKNHQPAAPSPRALPCTSLRSRSCP